MIGRKGGKKVASWSQSGNEIGIQRVYLRFDLPPSTSHFLTHLQCTSSAEALYKYRYLISSCRSLQSPSATSASREEKDTTPPRRQKGDGFDLGSVVDEPVLN